MHLSCQVIVVSPSPSGWLTPAFGGDAFTVPGAALAQGIQPPHLYEGQAAVAHLDS